MQSSFICYFSVFCPYWLYNAVRIYYFLPELSYAAVRKKEESPKKDKERERWEAIEESDGEDEVTQHRLPWRSEGRVYVQYCSVAQSC